MIEVKNLRKSYGDFEALKSVSFSVEGGSIYCLLGSNGAGKSTIIKIIAGLLRASEGRAYIDGIGVGDNIEYKRRFGYMPEEPHLYDRITGREFLDLMGTVRDMDESLLNRKIEKLAHELEITGFLDMEMAAYSKGMKQKILFANAIIHGSPNLILDEPTSGLDPRYTRYIKRRLKKLAQEGRAVLMSTHITSIAADISDMVGIIHNGILITEGSVDDLLSMTGTENLEDAFVEVVDGVR